VECDALPACSPIETDDATCADGRDNDDDGATDCVDDDCAAAGVCQSQALRVVHWNIQEVFGGDAPSLQGEAAIDAAAAMLLRMNADVACLNEVHDDEGFALVELAERASYPFVFQSEISTPMAGGLTNACLSRRPFSIAQSRSSDDISSDADANETGRDFAEVRVDVVPGVSSVTILSAHLKSGFAEADHFRKHIEALRIRDLVQQIAQARPDDAVIVMGDMNEEIDEEPSLSWSSFPDGMPFSYRLGADLEFPFTYGPFEAFAEAGLVATLPTHEDSSDTGTRIPSGRRIDYQLFRGLTLVGDLVYDPCTDDGVDDPPVGNFLVLAGPAVPCGTAEDASDHWPVIADYAP
jgi:endonuclease/exonuclease/phosphatase family metal-dependent hydrolase